MTVRLINKEESRVAISHPGYLVNKMFSFYDLGSKDKNYSEHGKIMIIASKCK